MVSRRILLVDDEVLLLRTLSTALREDGFEVLASPSAEDAERQLEKPDPVDVFVLDVKLPGRSGFDLLRQRRQVGYDGRVVIMSAFDGPDSERDCRALDVDHFLRKPFDLEKLLEMVRNLANGAADRTARAEGGAPA